MAQVAATRAERRPHLALCMSAADALFVLPCVRSLATTTKRIQFPKQFLRNQASEGGVRHAETYLVDGDAKVEAAPRQRNIQKAL